MSGEPTMEELRAEFPGWHFWVGIERVHYGRKLKSSPPAVVRGGSWAEVAGLLRARAVAAARAETGQELPPDVARLPGRRPQC
jgi:hypothetical protein